MSTASPTAFLLWALLSVLVRKPTVPYFDDHFIGLLLRFFLVVSLWRQYIFVVLHRYVHTPPVIATVHASSFLVDISIDDRGGLFLPSGIHVSWFLCSLGLRLVFRLSCGRTHVMQSDASTIWGSFCATHPPVN